MRRAATPERANLARTRAREPSTAEPTASALTPSALLDAHAAGAQLGVPHTWLLREARANRIPHRRLGKYVRWSAADLDWIVETMASGPRAGNGPARRNGDGQ